jgi:GWxTD domain-containing protein
MQFNNYGNSSLPYKGIEYDEYEIVRQTDRVLQQEGSVLLEIPVDPLSRGNYRFEVLVYEGDQEPTEDQESLLYKAREFAIKSENYPFLRTPRELAEPLVYLMKEDEYETMMAIEDDTQLKEAVDRFWLSNVQSLSDAGLTLEKYYQRVEEANKQFSNFKEGWKTDAGMMYILFGQPWYVERQVNVMRWSYSYDRSDPETNFLFEQPKVKNEFFPFNNYLLLRSQSYYSVYYRQLQLWLSGGILQRDI